MDEANRLLWAKGLLMKIHVITGWILPADEFLAILVEQFDKKLTESFPKVNPDEMEYAFRNAEGIKNWGKHLNISLIDEVMGSYLSKRANISRIEETQIKELTNPVPEMSDDELWDETEKAVKKGGYPVDLIPPGLYEWMDSIGCILTNKEEKLKYMERATLYRHSKLAAAYEADPSSREAKKALNEFNAMRETKVFQGPELESIKMLAKKMVVFDMMKSA